MKSFSLKRMISLLLVLLISLSVIGCECDINSDNSNGNEYSTDTSEINDVVSSVTENEKPEEIKKPVTIDSFALAIQSILVKSDKLGSMLNREINRTYLENISEVFGKDSIEALADGLDKNDFGSSDFKELFGYSPKAFVSIVENDLERTVVSKDENNGIAEFVFVGDCSFANGSSVMRAYRNRKKGVEGLVSEEVLDIMRSADVAMANNEFTFTERGAPIPNKRFTFRGNPDNVSLYHEMGIDIVGMANNHAFDYGPDSLSDTLTTLDSAGIAHVGAGENINDAKEPFYYIVNGYKFAVIAGSSVDFKTTRCATEELSGVFQFATPDAMVKEIIAAKEKADYVIVYMHWGKESTTVLTDMQTVHGKAFIDAGADIVVGMHSHCMQGMEYYKGKLLVYSLGNFTFSNFSLTCGMLKMSVLPDGSIENKYYPMMQSGNNTYINSGDKGIKQFNRLKKLLINADISEEYVVAEKIND